MGRRLRLWQGKDEGFARTTGLASSINEIPTPQVVVLKTSSVKATLIDLVFWVIFPRYNHKKSQGFVRNEDQVSGSGADGHRYAVSSLMDMAYWLSE
ncbi:hypothetical protein Tco_1183564 [Tanacetum coccineum]